MTTTSDKTNLSGLTDLPVISSDDFLPPMHRWINRTGLTLAVAILAAAGLSSVIKYEVAVKAEAILRPEGELRLVQPAIEGSVSEILVKENQTVRKGDIVARLDSTQLKSQRTQLQETLQQLEQQLAQISSQQQSLNSQIVAETIRLEAVVTAAAAELSQEQQAHQNRALTAQANVTAAQASVSLAQEQLGRYQNLLEVGAIATAQVQEKAALLTTAQSELVKAETTAKPATAHLAIAQAKIDQQRAQGSAAIAALKKEQAALSQQQNQMQTQVIRTTQSLKDVEQQLQKTIIRATANGRVLGLNLRNIGQIVRPADQLLQLAPSNAPLVVQAKIPTQNIHKIRTGQTVQLKVTACPYPDYGVLAGTVRAIAADATQPTATEASTSAPAHPYFEVEIVPNSETFGPAAAPCQLQAGMATAANIITEQDTALRFLLRKARLLSNF